jgi:hypothetical protein
LIVKFGVPLDGENVNRSGFSRLTIFAGGWLRALESFNGKYCEALSAAQGNFWRPPEGVGPRTVGW